MDALRSQILDQEKFLVFLELIVELQPIDQVKYSSREKGVKTIGISYYL